MDLPLSDHHRVFTPFILERLQKAGITNAQQFLQSRNDRLSQISGLPLKILTQVREAILKRLVDSSVDLSKCPLERPPAKYPTGIVLLDDLLHGGFDGGSINEFIGFTSCGKTYLTQSICLRLLYGHDQLNALIITNSPGVAGSLRSILECQNIDSDTIDYLLNKVKLQSYVNITQLEAILKHLLKSGSHSLRDTHKILLIDGLSSEFLQHYMELDRVFNSQVASCLQILRQLSQDYGFLIHVTNITMTRNEVGRMSEYEAANYKYSEVTNHDWTSFMDNRFLINKIEAVYKSEDDGDGLLFELKVRLIKSRHMATGATTCAVIPVTDRGIE